MKKNRSQDRTTLSAAPVTLTYPMPRAKASNRPPTGEAAVGVQGDQQCGLHGEVEQHYIAEGWFEVTGEAEDDEGIPYLQREDLGTCSEYPPVWRCTQSRF